MKQIMFWDARAHRPLSEDYSNNSYKFWVEQPASEWVFDVPQDIEDNPRYADVRNQLEWTRQNTTSYIKQLWGVKPIEEIKIPTVALDTGDFAWVHARDLFDYTVTMRNRAQVIQSVRRANKTDTWLHIKKHLHLNWCSDVCAPNYEGGRRESQILLNSFGTIMKFKVVERYCPHMQIPPCLDTDREGTPYYIQPDSVEGIPAPQALCTKTEQGIRFISRLGRFTYYPDGRIKVDGIDVIECYGLEDKTLNWAEYGRFLELFPQLLYLVQNQTEILQQKKNRTKDQENLRLQLLKLAWSRSCV